MMCQTLGPVEERSYLPAPGSAWKSGDKTITGGVALSP